jgi:DNA polymerase III alpha subunit (gram-positive type)
VNTRNMLFFDLETTGLDPKVAEIIEAAWRLTSPDGKKVLMERTFKVFPEHMETASKEALEVNGYTPEGWTRDQCISQEEFAKMFWQVSNHVVLGGHGVNFDEGFVREVMARFNLKPKWHYQSADTQKLAWPLFITGRIPSVGLKHVSKYFGWEQPSPHRALSDVDLTHKVFMALIDAYTKSIAA